MGKYLHARDDAASGIQIENRVYLEDGHHKLINSKSVEIVEVYEGIPEWAFPQLVEMYKEHMANKQDLECN